MDDVEQPSDGSSDFDVKEAIQWVEMVNREEQEIRDEARLCAKFLALDQWDPIMKQARGDQRPSLVFDQLGQYVSQVTNDWRKNRLGVEVHPSDGGTDAAAEALDGRIREIEYCSLAHVAYDTAFEQMVGLGRGYFGITTRRIPGSFEKEIAVRVIPDSEQVYFDPFCRKVDYSDARRSVEVFKMGLKQFKADFPGAARQDFNVLSAQFPQWAGTDWVLVASDWKATPYIRKLLRFNRPVWGEREGEAIQSAVFYEDEVDMSTFPDDVQLVEEAEDQLMSVKQRVLSGLEVLFETDWPGFCIPIVPMVAKRVFVDGKLKIFSLISRGLDCQRSVNYALSSMAERLGQFCRTPIIGAVGQFKTHKQTWDQLNNVAVPYVEYDMVGPSERPAPAPQRADFDPRIDQMIAAAAVSREYVRNAIGMYEASLGESETRARSGVAINALKREGDNAIFDFLDNGARAIELGGRIMIDLIPKIHSGGDIRIRGIDGKPRLVPTPQFTGKYSVTVGVAPSHESERAAAAEYSMELYKNMPPVLQAKALPAMLGLQVFPGAKKIKDAIDPTPPNLRNLDPGVAQVFTEMDQTIEKLTNEVTVLLKEREQKMIERETELARESIRADATIRAAQIRSESAGADALANRDAAQMAQIAKQAHEAAMASAAAATQVAQETNEPKENP